MKEIAILGSTGSIGTQTLEVIAMHKDRFHAALLAARSNIALLREQAERFQPSLIAITDEEAGRAFLASYEGKAKVIIGERALVEAVEETEADVVLTAVVGIAGLLPTLAALKRGKQVALANKETLVAGGELVTTTARDAKISILPVDSEHSAVFQCLQGQDRKGVHKIILTASGGPFRGKTREELEKVTLADALKHPTWHMGRKVTIDSASLFNKGLEVIEAHWLFDVPYDDIDVMVQPQSIVHSMVEYDDGSIIAELGEADMRLPIQLALTYPERLPSPSRSYLDWRRLSSLTFELPDTSLFRSLPMAYEAGKAGGIMTAVYNAANEEGVKAFVEGRIGFLQIFDTAEEVLSRMENGPALSLDAILAADEKTRHLARDFIRRHER